MNRNFKDMLSQKGSMMVEALAMLGLISMVTPVLYKKAAERTTELQDINSATYMRTLSQSLDDYIQDNYSDLSQESSDVIAIDNSDIQSYLPYGFNVNGSKLFDDYNISVIRDVHNIDGREVVNLTGVITAPISIAANDSTRETRKAKIASMIGANGGVKRGDNFTGVLGGWEIPVGSLGLDADYPDSVAVTSVHAITSGGSAADSEHVLYRDNSRGDVAYNTMQTTLYMDTNNIEGISNLVAASNEESPNQINIVGADNSAAGLMVSGAAEIQQALTAGLNDENTAKLNVADTFYAKSADKTSNLTLENGRAVLVGNDSKLEFKDTKTSLVGKNSELKFDNAGATMTNGGNKGAKLALSSQDAQLTFGEGANGYSVGESSASVTFNSSKVNLNAGAVAIQSGSDGGANAKLKVETSGTVRAESSGENGKWTSFKVNSQGIYGDAAERVVLESGSNMTLIGNESFTLSTNIAAINAVNDLMDIGAGRLNLNGNEIKLIGDNKVYLNSGNNSIELNGDKDFMEFKGGNAHLKLDDGNKIAKLYYNNNIVAADANTVFMQASGGSMLEVGDDISIKPASNLNAYGDNIYLNPTNRLHVESSYNQLESENTLFCDGGDCPNTEKNSFNKGVLVQHQGIVALPTAQSSGIASSDGVQDVAGYVKADRFLANQTYTSPYTSSKAGSKPYDAYQVNPAYTSVMHDIKLTTRGGARLSDILPDFINKGIYVVDNTYKEDPANLDWENFTKDHNHTSCGTDLTCTTTPWLGFIPAPQCPPGYAKVITINPIRWKMADVYTVAPNLSSYSDAYRNFRTYFNKNTDPLKSRFELETVDGSSGAHTHGVTSGLPLTFQTNTWLNTTIYGVRATPGDVNSAFYGWHAIMGFLYHGSLYSDYIMGADPTAEDPKGKVVWNIFPVYNQELTAISNVYCYFERKSNNNSGQYGSGNTGVSWDSNLVDTTYDQLEHFRSPTDDKDANYVNRLNDPTLGYTDPW